jgi:hypothetical protein
VASNRDKALAVAEHAAQVHGIDNLPVAWALAFILDNEDRLADSLVFDGIGERVEFLEICAEIRNALDVYIEENFDEPTIQDEYPGKLVGNVPPDEFRE